MTEDELTRQAADAIKQAAPELTELLEDLDRLASPEA